MQQAIVHRLPISLACAKVHDEMQSRTRSLFTHMTGVKLYEDVIASTDVTGSPTPALTEHAAPHV